MSSKEYMKEYSRKFWKSSKESLEKVNGTRPLDVKDCFAYGEGFCKALRKQNCENCKFYRSDINLAYIEQEIESYGAERI